MLVGQVRAEGDIVRMGDQIVLESVKTVGQHVHAGRGGAFPSDALYKGCYEVNSSVTPSGFEVVPHYAPRGRHKDEFLKGGDVIRLYHKEYEAYLAAEGVFNEEKDVEDVHLRVRHMDGLREHSTASIVYWQGAF